jgi:hypothetical protein
MPRVGLGSYYLAGLGARLAAALAHVRPRSC